ncbi:hypothetical protein FA13DRAFT_1719111 [Coprinellus micaceus]|uniref:Uncharacterized protein n=1 Tax=Coprinellus micaceus TaxID=71717 RepID=A0A4Y7SC08_COPMI|nr:hypothetical protein FA13DRAFT_1719111 [Coprinellus micaceus]
MASDGPSQSATLHPSLGTVFPRQVSTSTSGLFSAGAPRGWGFGAPNPPLGPTGDTGPAPMSQMFGPSTALMDANSGSSSFGNVGFSSIHDFDESLVNPWGDVVSQPNRSGQPNLLGLGFSAASTPRPPQHVQHVDLRPRTGRHQGWGFSGSDSSSPDPRSPSPSHHEPSPKNPGDPAVLASGGGQERRHEFSPMRQSPGQPPPAGYAQGFPTYPPQQPNWPAFTQAQVPPNSFQHPGPYQHHPVFPAPQHPFYSQPPFPPQQPFMPQQPFVPQQPIFPPVNPFYVQAPMPAPRERQLPRTKHGEVLKGNGTFHAWSLWARNLAKSEGLLSHISRPNEIGLRRTEQPSYPPPNANPTVDAVAATLHENWWVDDDAMRHILTSRLDPAICVSVPYVNPTSLEATTSREIWEYLWRNYGTGTTSAVLQRWKAISSRRITADRVGDLPEYVAEFREIYECMLVARQPVTDESVLVALADAIPDLGGLAALSRDFRLAADHRTAEPITSHSAFEQLTHEVEVYLRRHPQPAKKAAKAGSSTGSKSSRITVVCSNCKQVGHELEDCFQPGGPKEGKADEVRAARKARGSRTSGIAAVATPAAPTTAVTPTAVTSCAPDSAMVATPSLVAAALPANDPGHLVTITSTHASVDCVNPPRLMCQPPPLTNGGMSQVGVYEGSAGVPPAHRVGVVVVAGHGKGNSGASVDGFSEAQVVGRSTDMQSGERRAVRGQQRVGSGVLCADNSGASVDGFSEVQVVVRRSTDMQSGERRAVHGQQRWWVGRRTFRVGSGVLCTDNSGASVDGFSEVQVVGRSTDIQSGERRAVHGQQRWWVGRRTFRVGSGVLCTDNSGGGSVDGYADGGAACCARTTAVVRRSTDMQSGERRAVHGQQRRGSGVLCADNSGSASVDGYAERRAACCARTTATGERRAVRGQQRWWVGRRICRAESGVLCTDNSVRPQLRRVGRRSNSSTGLAWTVCRLMPAQEVGQWTVTQHGPIVQAKGACSMADWEIVGNCGWAGPSPYGSGSKRGVEGH